MGAAESSEHHPEQRGQPSHVTEIRPSESYDDRHCIPELAVRQVVAELHVTSSDEQEGERLQEPSTAASMENQDVIDTKSIGSYPAEATDPNPFVGDESPARDLMLEGSLEERTVTEPRPPPQQQNAAETASSQRYALALAELAEHNVANLLLPPPPPLQQQEQPHSGLLPNDVIAGTWKGNGHCLTPTCETLVIAPACAEGICVTTYCWGCAVDTTCNSLRAMLQVALQMPSLARFFLSAAKAQARRTNRL